VRGRDVVVLQSLHGDDRQGVDARLCRLLFFCGTVRGAGASSVTVVAPYLCYARKDRRTKPRDPVTTRYVAQLIEAMGVDRMVLLDAHNPAAAENAFRVPVEHLEAGVVLARHLADALGDAPLTVVAPDAGGAKRAEALRATLADMTGADVGAAYAEKLRSGGRVTGDLLAGEVGGRVAVIVDDMISTGTTIARTARRCRERGAVAVVAAATHAVFAPGADAALSEPAVSAVVVTDSVAPRPLRGAAGERTTVVGVAPLLAEAVRRILTGGSLTDLDATGPPEGGGCAPRARLT
jgi:ribose-phosphate pyrophosphokinase